MEKISLSHRRNFILSVALLFVSLFISALAAEVILRILGHHGAPQLSISNIYPVNDPVLDWRYVPNSEHRLGRVIYKYNSSGFRDVDHMVEKPPGVTRIVVVGDSVTEGHGVQSTSVFSHLLRSPLDDNFEVITIAAGGLNTPQEIHLLEQEGLLYKPDLVVVNFVLNDCDFYTNFKGILRYTAEKDSRIGLLNVSINPELKRLLKSSALIYFVKERMEELKGRLLETETTNYFSDIWAEEENRNKVVEGFRKLEALGEENDFDVLVIIWPLITDYSHYGFGFVHDWVKDQAENMGFWTIDLLSSFSNMPYRDLQVTAEDNIHPNALGHKIAAEAFVKWHRWNGVSTR